MGRALALDVSAELAEIIETSWAFEEVIPPHHIYLHIAYHLSTEARAGLTQVRLPGSFEQSYSNSKKRCKNRCPPLIKV